MTKEDYAKENEMREKNLIAHYETIKDKYSPGDILLISNKYNSEECGILRESLFTKRECGELFIKVPLSIVSRRLCENERADRSYITYDIFKLDDYTIKIATDEDIERCCRKYIKEEIDDQKDVIKEAKEEIRRLKKINSSLKEKLEELKEEIKKTSE